MVAKKKLIIFIMLIAILVLSTTATFAIKLEINDRGEDVKKVQSIFNNLGYEIDADGIFGQNTKNIVMKFQENNGLKVDGIVGNNTYQLLEELATDVYYKVKQGDTLSEIALDHHSDIEAIKEENKLTSNRIKIGQKLIIPRVGRGGGEDHSVKNQLVHAVQSGDSLSVIAKRYGTSIVNIKLANNLKTNRIYVDQKLIIKEMRNSNQPIRLAKGAFIWPVMGRISSYFGWRTHPIKRSREFHNGLDIAVPYGTSIKAVASGTVTHSGWMSGFGRTVIVDHGRGIKTLYAHNTRLLVRKGLKVHVGQDIALAGSTGLSTGTHLHFGLLSNDNPVNPLNYLP